MTTQEQLNDLLTWEKVYEWAKQHEQAPWLAKSALYKDKRYIGRSNNSLNCPIGCYLNEVYPTPEWWYVVKDEMISTSRYEEAIDPHDEDSYIPLNYEMPLWVRIAMRLLDEHYKGPDALANQA